MTTLKPCPACSCAVEFGGAEWVECSNKSCAMYGPIEDHNGEKWNALPRRGDATNAPAPFPSWLDRARIAEKLFCDEQLFIGTDSQVDFAIVAVACVQAADALIAALAKEQK